MIVEVDRRTNRLKDANTPIDIFQVPMALGANREGAERGPAELDLALRQRLERRGYHEIAKRLNGSVVVDVMSLEQARGLESEHANAHHLEPIAESCDQLAEVVGESITSGNLALVLGGDHALSIGSLAGASLAGRLGVIWVDAHTDINTPETSPSGNIHGMPLSAALGHGPRELVEVGHHFDLVLDDLVYIGVRDIDLGERELLRQSPATVYTMESIDRLSIAGVGEEAIRRLIDRGVDAVHLSIDYDVLDPTCFDATGTVAPGGLTYRELRQLITLFRDSDLPIVSADLVELNPSLDSRGDGTTVAATLATILLGETLI